MLEKAALCVTRNADITPNDEAFEVDEDFRQTMRKLLKERRRLAAVRLELGNEISRKFRQYFCQKLHIEEKQCYVTSSPIKMGYAFSLADKLSESRRAPLLYEPFAPQPSSMLIPGESVIKQVLKRDILLSYPFESMEPFLQMVREAAFDPAVQSIKISIYRMASRAKLVEYLCAAAENGKDVTTLIELRARFDEQNNIDWSQRLEEAGCNILYGFDSYKVHSKVCLITRKDRSGVQYITQIGTGNYNEKTAKQYTDLSYITSRKEIGQDAAEFFKNMAIRNLEGEYPHLLVAPHAMKDRLLKLIDREIEKGDKGRIFLKVNSVTELELIDRLRDASCAGVRVEMIVRGICCLLPRVETETDNVKITSIVGRYLEHSRIYLFGEGADEVMYISSADFMTRNMDRRVEVGCPIVDPAIRARIHRLIDVQRADNTKARLMRSDGTYQPVVNRREPVDSQQTLMDDAIRNAIREKPAPTLASRLKSIFSRKR